MSDLFYSYLFQERRGRTRNSIPIKDVLNRIVSDELYGFLKCDVKVPEHLKQRFSQFPPIFKNIEISISDVGPYMKQLCEKTGCLQHPRKTLISSYFGKDIVLTTCQLKWYILNGEFLFINRLYLCSDDSKVVFK